MGKKMKPTIQSIQNQIPYLNPALRRIAEYILDNKEQCQRMTIKELATICEVAESTVTRFVKELGFKNYQDLKLTLAQFLSAKPTQPSTIPWDNFIYEDINENEPIDEIINKVCFRNIQIMTATREMLNYDALEKAVKLIEQSDYLIFSGFGSSAVACEEGIMRFLRAGKYCLFPRDNTIQMMTGCVANAKTTLIAISHSGKTTGVINTLKYAKEQNASTITITSDESSPIIKYSDTVLFTPEKPHPIPSAINWESTASKTAQIMIIDVLYAIYASRNFTPTLNSLNKTYLSVKDTRE
ncbi:MAG: MurR/RpiR family transcriptional regulator [Eubacteriaceae bacterium]